ncbi:IPP transferase [Gossypium australe]|uniref:IPP transferase n=1 Tax=Gossypium australe TaxID=47621 RepID=A0A5B6WTJ2_9ROSI|nr:IPP transferase [Gossypium australe]
MYFHNRLCVPNNSELKRDILSEAHNSTYSIHPGRTKMFNDLKKMYWWPSMKCKISEFATKCLPITIPEWKQERVTMDFVLGLPMAPRKNDSIWVIIDRLTKSTHLASVRTNYSLEKLAELYVSEIERIIRDCLKAASDLQKSYADLKRKDIEFVVGDRVFLKVSPSYEITESIGPVAYKIVLPPTRVFHREDQVRSFTCDTLCEVEIQLDLSYSKEPIRVLAREIKELRNKRVPLVKVLWNRHGVEEAT